MTSDSTTHTTHPRRLPAHLRLRIAVAAPADPRSVDRYISGQRMQPLVAERIERALRELSLAHLVRVERGATP